MRHGRPAALAALLVMAIGGVGVGCAGRHHGGRTAAAAAVRSCGDSVVDCIPLGAVELVGADLDAIRARPALRLLLDGYRPDDTAAFERSFGFAPSSVHRLAYGRYEPGELWVVEGDFDAASVVAHVGQHMNTLEIVDADPPRRVGFVGVMRVDVAAVGPHRLALGSEHGAPMQRLLARLHGQRVPSQVERMDARLATRMHDAAIAFGLYMPGRFSLDTDVGLLLAGTEWVGGTVADLDATTVELRADVYGALPASAEANLRSLVATVAESELGGVFGIRDALPTFRIRAAADGAALSIHLDASQLASALRLILGRLREVRSQP